MRKAYFFLFLILILWSNAQIVNIPDVNFKNYLLAHFDGNQDNQIQVSEAQNVYSINLTSSLSISDITGIEHFSNLTMLIIKYNNITAPVNLSQNTNLNVVTLWGSSPSINISGLSVLKYADLNGKYTSVDLTNKPLLEQLFLGSSNLNTVNVTSLPLLKRLWISDAGLITSINVTQNPLLEELVLQQLNLTSIDVTQNPNLTFLSLNGSPIGTVNISQNVLLERLSLDDTGITSVNLQNNPLINYLDLGHNNLSAGIDLSNLLLLEELSVFQSNLSTLNLSNNLLLKWLSFGNNSLTNINVSHLALLQNFSSVANQLTQVDLSNNPALKYVDFTSNSKLTHINLKNGGNHNLIWLSPTDYGWLPKLQEVCVDDPSSYYAIQVNSALPPAVNVTAQCTALDTQEVSIEKTDIKIFPNPVEDVLYIRTKEKLVSYEIISSIGSLVEKGNFDKGAFSVNMQGLSKGIYYIKMSNERFTTTSKVIKK